MEGFNKSFQTGPGPGVIGVVEVISVWSYIGTQRTLRSEVEDFFVLTATVAGETARSHQENTNHCIRTKFKRYVLTIQLRMEILQYFFFK